MIYKAIAIQNGEGCDYTIGCGIQVIDVPDGLTKKGAIDWLQKIIDTVYQEELALKSCKLYEIIEITDMKVD